VVHIVGPSLPVLCTLPRCFIFLTASRPLHTTPALTSLYLRMYVWKAVLYILRHHHPHGGERDGHHWAAAVITPAFIALHCTFLLRHRICARAAPVHCRRTYGGMARWHRQLLLVRTDEQSFCPPRHTHTLLTLLVACALRPSYLRFAFHSLPLPCRAHGAQAHSTHHACARHVVRAHRTPHPCHSTRYHT